jgi:hypothetical protein
LDGMYSPLFWLFKFGCPWTVAPPLVGNGGGHGALYAIDPSAPAYPWFCASVCLDPMTSYNLRKVR